MPARELPAAFLDALSRALGPEQVLTDPGERLAYGYDNSRRQELPGAVAFAADHDQVLALVRLCNEARVPLVPRGRGTGTTGATVPLEGALVLSLERMAGVLSVDAPNRVARVEPGITNQDLQDAAAREGFFWPPDPTSAAYCTVGGNLAYNSAGPRAVKYGTPRDNTLGLRAVTGAGETLRTGVYTTKGVVGYDLTRLLVGSEGTLAIITEATLRLTPLARTRRAMRALYRDIAAATGAITRVMAQPVIPSSLELLDGTAVGLARDHGDLDLPADVGAMLLLEVDGQEAAMADAVAAVQAAAGGPGLLAFDVADRDLSLEELWAARRALSPALRTLAPKKINEDVVVPVSRLPELISGLEALGAEHGIRIVNFGHAGNGNIHVNLLADHRDPGQMEAARRCLDRVFDLVLALGGTLSGEHGVGLEKRDFVARELDPVALALMRGIKRQFDPRGILNPGKMLPPER